MLMKAAHHAFDKSVAVGVHPQRGWWQCGGVGDTMQAVGVHPQVVVVVLYSAERGCTPIAQ